MPEAVGKRTLLYAWSRREADVSLMNRFAMNLCSSYFVLDCLRLPRIGVGARTNANDIR